MEVGGILPLFRSSCPPTLSCLRTELASCPSQCPHQRLTIATPGNSWNGGEIYGPPDYNSLVLLERYFEKYPEDAEKVVLSIKGGVNPATHKIDGTAENTRRTLDDSIAQLKGRKKIDLFEFARRDPNVPLEFTFGIIEKEYIQTGKIGGISLSEVRAETIHEAVKHTKVLAVEVELSLSVTATASPADPAPPFTFPPPLTAS